MKRWIIRKFPALFLALLMLLGSGTAALAAESTPVPRATPAPWMLSIAPIPGSLVSDTFIVGINEPSLAGLQVTANSSKFAAPVTLTYGDSNVYMSIELEGLPKAGSNDYTLYVECYINGNYYYGNCTITFTGQSLLAIIGTTADVVIGELDKAFESNYKTADGAYTVFSYTAASDGIHSISVESGLSGSFRPFFLVLDAAGNLLASSSYDYGRQAAFKAGETYYIIADYMYYSAGAAPANTKVSVTVVFRSLGAINLGDTKSVTKDGYYAFTPAADGDYTFVFDSYNVWATLYDADFNWIRSRSNYIRIYSTGGAWYEDWDEGWYEWYSGQYYGSAYTDNYRLTASLKAGKTYYLAVEGSGSVTLRRPKVDLTLTDASVNVDSFLNFNSVVQAYDYDTLYVDIDSSALGYGADYWFNIYFYNFPPLYISRSWGLLGMHRGSAKLTFYDENENALGTSKVDVTFSLGQWLLYAIGGFLWMEDTAPFYYVVQNILQQLYYRF